jgi:hypothetical protein
MRLLGIPFLLLLASAALADFGPSTQFTTASSGYVAVASTTTGPLAVWREDTGVVRANGQLIAEDSTRIAASSLGDFALVVWTEPDGSVTAVRRRPDGTSAGVERHIGSNATGPVAVIAAGDRYFVAWAGSLGQVYASIVTSLGDRIVPAMPVTTQSTGTIDEVSAAASADGYAIVWHVLAERKVFAVTVHASGAPVSMTPLLLSGDGGFPDVASDGSGFFAVWGIGTIYARTLELDGTLGRVRTVTTGVAPRVVWDGFAYGLAFIRDFQPRPGTYLHQLVTMRISEYGTYVEGLQAANTLLPRSWDVDARPGRLDLVYSLSWIAVQSATVGEPRTRIRVLRH